MPETPEDQGFSQPETTSSGGKERVGDLLRKERVTRRITIETVAKDLKLNVEYIKAIEENDYGALPAEPYVRVYLRSIAGYLMLDTDDIIKRFNQEQGLPADRYEQERKDTISIRVNERDKRVAPRGIIVLVLLVVAGLVYLGIRMGLSNEEQTAGEQPTAAVADTTEQVEEEADSLPPFADERIEDVEAQEQGEENGDQEAQEKETDTTAQVTRDSLELVIAVKRDSVWAQVFTDGDSWRNFIHAGRGRRFHARDSFNINVGNNSLVTYVLNGERIDVNGKGITKFRLDHDGVTKIPSSKWRKAFKDRM